MRRFFRKIQKRFTRQTFAINELDRKLAKFVNKRRGFFIEAGANDGIKQSNSLYFEKYLNWKGLLVEPIPALAEKCKHNRPFCIVENCALVSSSYDKDTVYMKYNDLMSIVKGTFGNDDEDEKYIASGTRFLRNGEKPYSVTVPARTLSSILTEHHIENIDLLSLDVEGYELDVLQGIDFRRHAPDFLLIEMWHHKKDATMQMLSPFYEQLSILYSNDLFSDTLFQVK